MANREALVIGSLLHDIGKFEFRTSDTRRAHTRYGDFFVSEYLSPFACLSPVLEDVRKLVAHHHDADAADPFLREADHLAASDRVVDGSPQTLRSLVSVLGAVDIGKGPSIEEVHRYKPGSLSYENPFPEHIKGVLVKEWKLDSQQAYDEHDTAWKAFCADVRLLPDGDIHAWTESFTHLAKKHLSRVASAAYKSHPDISLYDHARSVASIAVCLQEATGSDKPFLLIQGDLSGIQQYIYRLASPEESGSTKNMAKRMRGRSFHIGLLAETVALRYVRGLDLPSVNLLYSGGGHFLLLAPNTARIAKAWQAVEKEVNQWLLEKERGALALVCAAVEADRNLLRDFSKLMQESGAALGVAKRQKFLSVLDETLFTPRAFDDQMDVCPICQADFVKSVGSNCSDCDEHVESGRRIVQARYLLRVEGGQSDGVFEGLGFVWHLEENWSGVVRYVERLMGRGGARVHIECLNSADFISEETHALAERFSGISFGFRPLGQHAPRDEEEGGPRDFAELAADGTPDYPLLGVVRMDVDSLGSVFAIGLGEQRSLSRTATLSRELETFFSGYVNALAAQHNIYITYAGGDDLFAVGSWVNALSFARALRREFSRFSCGNPNLTLSGGLFFCKPGLPIGRAAEEAGALEEQAKERVGGAKNAVALFGEVVSWQRLDDLMDFAHTLHYLVTEAADKERLPRSFVHRLIGLGNELKLAQSPQGADPYRVLRVHTRLRYMVARRGATSKAIDARKEMDENQRKIGALGRLVTEPALMEEIGIPASYVLYKTRTLRKEHRENAS